MFADETGRGDGTAFRTEVTAEDQLDMKILLINPPLVGQRNDMLSAVPYQPLGLLSIAASLRQAGNDVEFLDCFAQKTRQSIDVNETTSLRGLWGPELIQRIPSTMDIIGISCLHGLQHAVVAHLCQQVKKVSDALLVIGGDHAGQVPKSFLDAGADAVVRGEGEHTMVALATALSRRQSFEQIPGLCTLDVDTGAAIPIADLNELPFPAYDLLDLEAYWQFGDAHGPLVGPYLDVITSRGCPSNCRFCAVPCIYHRRWRCLSAERSVELFDSLSRSYGVSDFHIQDASFTVDRARVLKIASLLAARSSPLTFSLPCGIKGETIEPADLALLKSAGLHYLVLAPESGSPAILKAMNKSIDFDHHRALADEAHRLGLKTAASFIIGFPGEEDHDRLQTEQLIIDLTRRGVDEFALFILCPFPGAAIDGEFDYRYYDELCVTPRWRADYALLARWRRRLLWRFFATKARCRPAALLRHTLNAMTGRFAVKGEMVVRRLLSQMTSSRTPCPAGWYVDRELARRN